MAMHSMVQRHEGQLRNQLNFMRGRPQLEVGLLYLQPAHCDGVASPLQVTDDLVLPCPAQMLCMAWLSCLSVHGQAKKDHGTGLGICLFTGFTANLLPGGFWPISPLSVHVRAFRR